MDAQPGAPRLIDLTIAQFADVLSSDQPAPGGGSVSALAGALGSALAAMVAGLTVGRERYAAYHDEMTRLRTCAESLKTRLLRLVDADADAYNQVTAAYRLPRQTEAQKSERAAAIEAALKTATQVPLDTAAACLEVLELAVQAAAHGNRNAGSDAVVGAFLAHAGLRGAVRNVRINLNTLRNAAFREAATARAAELLAAGEDALARTLRAADSGG